MKPDEVDALQRQLRRLEQENAALRGRLDAPGEPHLPAPEDHLRRLFDQAPTSMAILHGPELRFERINPTFLKAIGLTDIIGQPARSVLGGRV